MSKFSKIAGSVLLSILITATAACRASHTPAGASLSPPTVVAYGGGQSSRLSPDESNGLAARLLAELEQCNDLMRIVLDQETIADVRTGESCLELVWSSPQQRKVGPSDTEFSRMLVPLSGRFAVQGGLSFVLGTSQYTGPVFVKTAADTVLLRDLKQLFGGAP